MLKEHKERIRDKNQLKTYLYVVQNISYVDLNYYIREHYQQIGNHYVYVG